MRSRVLLAAAAVVCSAGLVRGGELRLATYNVERLDPEGSAAYVALLDVLARIDADVVLLQEIDEKEIDRIDDLAGDAGYAFSCLSSISGTLSGGLRTAAVSRVPLGACYSWSAADLSGDPAANDITRDVLEVHAEATLGFTPWGLFVVHLKAGGTDTDKFRRQVELVRVTHAIDRFRFHNPGSPVVLAGDMNEDLGDGPFGAPVFFALPPDLPPSYKLGSDIVFPVTYDPFVLPALDGEQVLDAFHEDNPADDETRWVSGRRLDYLEVDVHAGVEGTEVYDACDDNGLDDPPPGYWLPKTGEPLPCGTETVPSDHLAVFGDLLRLPVDQDGDAVDDAVDCAPLDPSGGTPPPIQGLVAEKLDGGVIRFSWVAALTADLYEIVGDTLPATNVAGALCRTEEDPDPGDTLFDDAAWPMAGSGEYLLVEGVDGACGGPGGYASGFPNESARPNEACTGN